MAERTQLQYQPVTGPVWSEPVASRMQWLPQGREFARGLPPNRLGDFVQPPFAALYKSEGLQWLPGGQQPARTIPQARIGDFSRPEFEALYKAERLEWMPSDRYAGRVLSRAINDQTVLVQLIPAIPTFDPQNIDWQPRDSYFGHPLARALVDWSIYQGDPIAPPPAPVVIPTADLGGGSRKKIRGPYSDPRIYEAYIARCIAEREKPRINLEAALVKEALVEEVEERHQTGYAEYDALIRENQILERLLALETAKRNLSAITARQRQIATQIEALEDDETRSVIMLLDEM
jgi:hypothetical protein